ncbi:MAG TPA: glycoside hydrolase family 44 protein [Verrucomicrobiae bacterium]|nr:glycoside hydrolase family 44 protein [Verrucomicrobiae bacterium]
MNSAMVSAMVSVLFRFFFKCKEALWLGLALAIGTTVYGQADQQIYTDALQNGWQNWGWATLNYNNTSPVHTGSESISVTIANNTYQAIYIEHSAFDSTGYSALSFWINGGAQGGQQLQLQGLLGSSAQSPVILAPLPTNSWRHLTISLASLGVANQPDLAGFWIQDRLGAVQPTFYLDDITLVANTNPPPLVTNSAVAISIDAAANRHPISRLIYGMAFAGSNDLKDLNVPLNRSGGNSETRYNWQLNAHNHAADWYFESIADSSAVPAAAADDHVANSKAAGAEPVLTIPMIGWVPRLAANRNKLASYSISKYGPQTGNDSQWFPDAGNGMSSTNANKPITLNDPNDANFATNSTFQQAFVQHLTNRWGMSSQGGVRYYCMDNEHSIWQSTHQDIHPVGARMAEIRDKFFDYAGKVKATDPQALLLAPEEWGWSGYFYSGYDQQYGSQHGWSSLPDRNANGGWDYLPWLLDQFRQRATNTNQRLLDYLTVHYYPQNGEYGNDTSSAMQLTRNRSTRSLWDTNYVDASWINSVVMLIPRLKNWAAIYYPGTKIGITEYNWGAEDHINGATAQADIFGIFGREGLDLATRWTTPASGSPVYNSIRMYRNYDGNGSTFGDTSIKTSSPNPDTLSAFGAVRSSDGALTLMVINKQSASGADLTVSLANFATAGTSQLWQLTSSNVITRLPDIKLAGNTLTASVPPQSITLFVVSAVPTSAAPWLQVEAQSAGNAFDLTINGQAGSAYVLQSTTNFVEWASLQTNTLASNSWHSVLSALPAQRVFYRVKQAP